MMSYSMSWKLVLSTAAAGVSVFGFMTTDVVAGSAARHQLRHAGVHHFARGEYARGAPVYNAGRPIISGYRQPGYAFVPGVEVPDDFCDLPSTGCWNDRSLGN